MKVERPLRLHSQLTRPRIETLRYASGDEEIRAALYEQLGDALFENPASVRQQLEQLVSDYGSGDSKSDDGEAGKTTARKALPEAKKKKLLSEATWRRDAQFIETAPRLREALGDGLMEDHNVFLERVEAKREVRRGLSEGLRLGVGGQGQPRRVPQLLQHPAAASVA